MKHRRRRILVPTPSQSFPKLEDSSGMVVRTETLWVLERGNPLSLAQQNCREKMDSQGLSIWVFSDAEITVLLAEHKDSSKTPLPLAWYGNSRKSHQTWRQHVQKQACLSRNLHEQKSAVLSTSPTMCYYPVSTLEPWWNCGNGRGGGQQSQLG